MLTRLADLVLRRRRLVLAVSVGVLAVMAVLTVGTFSVLKSGGFDDPSSASSRAGALLDRDFGGQTNLVLLVTPTDGRALDSPAVSTLAGTIAHDLSARSDVESVQSYWTTHASALRSTNGTSALITLHVRGDADASASAASQIIAEVAGRHGAADVRAGGYLGVNQDVSNQIAKDLALAEGVAVPITLLLLVLAFGNLLAALLPLAIGAFAVAGTFAELAVLGRLADVSIYAINLTTALGLGLAIDYSLLMVNRFREELRSGADVEDAVRTTVRTAGRTILFSSATVAVALAAMLIFPLYFLRSFAYAGIGVVVVALAAALFTLPAILATIGRRVATGRLQRNARTESHTWRRVATAVMRRPVTIALPVIVVLLVLGVPFLHIRFGTPDDRVLQHSAASRQVGDVLRSDYTGATADTIYAVIEGNPSRQGIAYYADALARLPGVSAVAPPVSARGATYLAVGGPPDSSSDEAQTLVRQIRDTPAPQGSEVLVGGDAAALVDGKAAIAAKLPWAGLWIALTTFVLLFLFTGSVVLPIKALVLNAVSLSAVFGAIVWIFQYGHLSGLLGFTPMAINTAMPVLLFCIAFGLSMDYEVFLLSRIKEAHDEGASTTEAVAAGLARTGRIVTTAAALLSITFFAFATSKVNFIQLFGIGTGFAVVLDATVIRGLLVPAFMRVAGAANWWAPAPLRRLYERIGLSEHEPPRQENGPTSSTVTTGSPASSLAARSTDAVTPQS